MEKFSNISELLSLRAQSDSQDHGYTFLADGEVEKESYSFRELDKRARSIGAWLQDSGVPGKQVLLLFQPGLEFVAAFFGCLYAGAVAVPAYPPRPNKHSTRIQAIVKDADVQLVLTTSSLLTKLTSQNFLESNLKNLRFQATDAISDEQGISWDIPQAHGDALAFLQYTSGSTGAPKGVMVSHNNLIHNQRMIQKAFGHTENSLVVGWLPLFHDMGLVGNILQPLWLGISCVLMSPAAFLQKPIRWLQAISTYKATTSGGPNFAYDLCVEKITPEQRKNLNLTSWDVAFMGAEPIRKRTIDRFTQTFESCGFRREACYPCYGLAEATLFVSGGIKAEPPVVQIVEMDALTQHRMEVPSDDQRNIGTIVGCGMAWGEGKVLIVEPETFIECLPGQIGEIWVSGSHVAQGFWNRQEETACTFQAYLSDTCEGAFLRTGDLGFWNNKELFVTGRLKDLIIIRGRNHYPQDIELTVENCHPALRPGYGAAFSLDLEVGEQLVVTHEIEHSYLHTLIVEEVIAAIRQKVAEQHELNLYAVCLLKTASIPKTSSGKIQRHACREGFLARSLNVVGLWSDKSYSQCPSEQPETQGVLIKKSGQPLKFQQTTDMEQESKKKTLLANSSHTEAAIQLWIVKKLAAHIQVSTEEIDVGAPTAQYGLDSSVAVSLTGELAEWLQLKLDPPLFWEYPSIASLARHLASKLESSRAVNPDDTATGK